MAFERLEPCAGKLARTVLRRVVVGNGRHLSDQSSVCFYYTLFELEIDEVKVYMYGVDVSTFEKGK